MQQDNAKEVELHACHHCGYEVNIPQLAKNEKAYCPRCRSFLKSGGRFSFETSFALSITTLILLVLSLPFEFLGIEGQGHEQSVTLWNGIHDIFHHDRPVLAIAIFVLVILVPAMVLVCSIFLFRGLCYRQCKQSFPVLFRVTYYGGNWAMAEVFLVGILVSLTKISSMASIQFGPAFFIYTLFVIMFSIALGNLDREQLWDAWEHFGKEQNGTS
jgi:paraquat-inducible protein A